ncbi:MAG: DinB family protein [Chloroflexi bacterium]|nr:DinB family protein [Chloroflexota bacterium]MBI3041180.1 DinB family protein [Chloroflexota bacterium]MBI3931732.1 DinB family protein [Chloroflexota bacterium]
MDWRVLLTDGYGRTLEVLARVLKGLTLDDLKWQPSADTNSIGWLTWHLTRIQDDHIASLMGEEQLWIKAGWYAKFNRPPDVKDLGFGNTPEQVAAFAADGETLLAYHRAVLARSKDYFLTLSDSDLDRELDEPRYQPLPTVGVRLISILADNLQHAGQAAYVRGLLQGRGWQRY